MIHSKGTNEYRNSQMSNDDTRLTALAGSVLSRESSTLAALVGAAESSVVAVARQMIDVTGKVVTTGSGTSGIMAERLAHLLSVCGTPAVYLPAMDALHGGMGAITSADMVVAISKTGQSQELTPSSNAWLDAAFTWSQSPRVPTRRSPSPREASRCCPGRLPRPTPAT